MSKHKSTTDSKMPKIVIELSYDDCEAFDYECFNLQFLIEQHLLQGFIDEISANDMLWSVQRIKDLIK